MKKKTKDLTDVQLASYMRVIAAVPGIEQKGKTMPYTSLNGYMFTHLSKEGVMGIRLSQKDRENFIRKYNSTLFEQHGRIMKEFVKVPDDLLHNTKELSTYLKISFDHTMSLKPKK
jgi:hypothetical protein